MTTDLVVVVNDQMMLQYDRNKELPAHQQQHLLKLGRGPAEPRHEASPMLFRFRMRAAGKEGLQRF